MNKPKDKPIRERILETSLSLFNNHGYQTTTVRKIAQQLDVSSGHVQYHFKSKNDIALAHFPSLEHEIESQVLDVVKPDQMFTPYVGARDAIAIVRTIWRYRFIFLSLNTLLKEDEEIRRRYLRLQESIISYAESAFQQLIASGEMRLPEWPNSPRSLAESWWYVWLGWLRTEELQYHAHDMLPDKVVYEGALITFGVVSPFHSEAFAEGFKQSSQDILPAYSGN